MVVRGDLNNLSNGYNHQTGINFDDYMTRNLVIQNVDIQEMVTGIEAPFMVGRVPTMDTTLIQNSFLDNTNNIDLTPPRSVNGSNGLSPMTLNIVNVKFAHFSTAPKSSWEDITMNYIVSDSLGTSNFSIPQYVFVTNYNGTANDNFEVYYKEENHPANAVTMPLIYGYITPTAPGIPPSSPNAMLTYTAGAPTGVTIGTSSGGAVSDQSSIPTAGTSPSRTGQRASTRLRGSLKGPSEGSADRGVDSLAATFLDEFLASDRSFNGRFFNPRR
jgi:hypothetical protein